MPLTAKNIQKLFIGSSSQASQVIRSFKANINEPFIFERPDGSFTYANNELVSNLGAVAFMPEPYRTRVEKQINDILEAKKANIKLAEEKAKEVDEPEKIVKEVKIDAALLAMKKADLAVLAGLELGQEKVYSKPELIGMVVAKEKADKEKE